MKKIKLIATIMSLTMAVGMMGYATFAALNDDGYDVGGTITITGSLSAEVKAYSDATCVTEASPSFTASDDAVTTFAKFYVLIENKSTSAGSIYFDNVTISVGGSLVAFNEVKYVVGSSKPTNANDYTGTLNSPGTALGEGARIEISSSDKYLAFEIELKSIVGATVGSGQTFTLNFVVEEAND